MKFTRYDRHKKSGVEWLGEIPENWKVRRVKEIIYMGIYGTSEKSQNEGMYEVLGMGDIDDGRINFPHKNFLNHIKKELILKKGDLLLNRTNSLDLVGKVGLIEKNIQNVSFASYLIKLSLKSINSKSFFNYFLNSHNYLSNARCNSIKTANQANLSLSKYLQFFVSIPSQNEQINISNILDQKTSQIDKKIKLLQEKRESYEELKKTLINETVCRGLNKDVELKEANANWVGKIPSHWNVERLKNIFEERVEKNLNVDGTPVTTNILSVIKDVGVINHKEKGNVGNKMSEDITGYKIVHPKDIVVNKMNVLIGSVGISKEFGALSVIYIILKTKPKNNPEYYDYVFRSKYFQKYLRTISTGILEIRECVNSDLFRHQEFPQPPKQEQIQIANYLDEKTSKIDTIISKINDQIETLKEFRKTLINDVVTGKVRIQDE